MKAVEIKKDIYWVGAKDWNLREFHGYNTPDGSTYNAYLIMDKDITLVDGVKHYMTEEQLNRMKSVVDFNKLKYVVVNHVEQDHSGSIPQIMKLAPQAEIVTNMAGKQALEAHYDTTGWNFKVIKTGDVINIGSRNITFLTKAEDQVLSVACASVISRFLFLKEYGKLSKELGVLLPKGAGSQVDEVGKQIVEKFGEEKLKEIAKLSFKNTDKILNN